MPPVAIADSPAPENTTSSNLAPHPSHTMDSNHDLPARAGRDTDKHEQVTPAKEDPATVAASEELSNTTLHDKLTSNIETENLEEDTIQASFITTPEADHAETQDEEMRERISSPKKKRGRDQDDEEKDLDEEDAASSADGSVVNGSRSTRSEPEKKRRPRDTSQDFAKSTEKEGEIKMDSTGVADITEKSTEAEKPAVQKSSSPTMSKEKPQTSASAFASSGFASLASSSSPFGSISSTTPSVFGGNASTAPSGFGALAAGSSTSTTTSTTPSGFGALSDKPASGFSFGGGTSSGFGGLGTGSVFGSKLSNGFAGGSGPKLSSFAAASGKQDVAVGTKRARAFGAPESDEDGASNDEDSDRGAAGSDDEESAPAAVEDKKKSKISKVQIDDGEAGEATLLQIRAKLFALESKEVGWKERGVGTLKINVPKSCASYDPYGGPISGSFDASGIDEEEATPLVVRLVMRQENTHRVVLNTVILAGMEFQEKPAASTAQFLFTAFEGDKEPKPVNMLLKMSEANARLFRSEIDSIKRELSS